jgi:protoheme IX farnesyltransferase
MKFFSITKPGIIFGNLITATGGYLLASHSGFNIPLFFYMLLGIGLVIASGCVFNNIIDQDIDILMTRTKYRPLVSGKISAKTACYYGTFLGIAGFLVFIFLTNWLATILAFIGFFFYVVVYSLWLKRRSIHGTTIGGIAGAIPSVVGYCAVTDRFDSGAVALFFILFLWQLPHFYAIAIFRMQDFKNARLPILPLQKGIAYTKKVILLCTLMFLMVAILPTLLGYTGKYYLVISLLLSLGWIGFSLHGFFVSDERAWARKMFFYSIIVITIVCAALAISQ